MSFGASDYDSYSFDDSYGGYSYVDDVNGTNYVNVNVTGTNHTSNHSTDYYDGYYYYGDDYFNEDYVASTLKHKVYPFEEIVYVYIWSLLVILTTLANVLVILVLIAKDMRTSTNIILIAIAISDSLTGLVTLPAYMHAYNQRSGEHLILSRAWCNYFMLTKLFLTRAFHTISVWLTLVLGFQRLISVSYPFKAQSMFSIKKTLIIIVTVTFLAPVMHVYHLTEEKAVLDSCHWRLKKPCVGGCIYIWVSFYLAHFIPCLLLIVFTVMMVLKLRKATEKMTNAHMISNEANMRRRNADNRRISIIVIIIVILFQIPEIPYSVYLVVNVSLTHAGKQLLSPKTNRSFVCAYELLMVLSFHANFWVYLIMNRKFRRGLASLFEPCITVFYLVLEAFGVEKPDKRRRRQSVSSAIIKTLNSDVPSSPHEPLSDDKHGGKIVEMKKFTFDENGKSMATSGETSGSRNGGNCSM